MILSFLEIILINEVQKTYIEEIISDIDVTELYLSVHDAYPTKTLNILE